MLLRLLLAPLVLAAAIAALLWVGGGLLRPAGSGGVQATVLRAVDGDTLVVQLADGRRERVRVIGVDTPEDVDPRRPVECYSRLAAAFTARVAGGRRVVLRVGREARDRYGRLLAYVRVEGADSDLEEELLRRGFARPLAIPPNVDRAARYAALARQARLRRRGLWGACRHPFGEEPS